MAWNQKVDDADPTSLTAKPSGGCPRAGHALCEPIPYNSSLLPPDGVRVLKALARWGKPLCLAKQ